jgi:hypothetical protein
MAVGASIHQKWGSNEPDRPEEAGVRHTGDCAGPILLKGASGE